MRITGDSWIVFALLTMLVRGASAQHLPASVEARVPASLRTPLATVVDSAVAAGLPSAPLFDKAFEGVSKGADDHRILAAVRLVAADLGVARRTLGARSADELTAAAAAVRAGVTPARLRSLAQGVGNRPLVVPLSVLSSLVLLGTPDSVATTAVVAYAHNRSDEDVLAFGRTVAKQTSTGVTAQTVVAQLMSMLTNTAAKKAKP